MKTMVSKNAEWILTDKYGGVRTKTLEKDILRIQNGEPVDYVIGWIPFLGCRIDLSHRPFIPRTETEYWVKQAIGEIKLKFGDKPMRILDIFAGSGCIGVALLKHLPNTQADFAERCENAVAQIQKNLYINEIDTSRIKIIQSDIFENIHGKYDVIFANPPYVPFARKDTVARLVRKYEPQDAIFGGQDGLDVIRRFLHEARQHLNFDGVVWMEFDAPEKDKIGNLISEHGYAEHEFFQDQFGMWRFVKIIR